MPYWRARWSANVFSNLATSMIVKAISRSTGFAKGSTPI
jgi:hypothetical protein